MQKLVFSIFSVLQFLSILASAQIVSISPTGAGADEPLLITFKATEGNAELVGASKVYMHHGVITDSPTGTNWQYVIGDWGFDNGVGEMSPVQGEADTWQLELSPSVRAHFDVPANSDIFRIAAVFRNADGSIKATTPPGDYGWGTVADNFDMYIDLNVSNYLTFLTPLNTNSFLNAGASLIIEVAASSLASNIMLSVDAGSGFETLTSLATGTIISYEYTPVTSGSIAIKCTATVNGEDLEIVKNHGITLIQANNIVDLPILAKAGINYYDDDTTVVLVLEAPQKNFAHVVGDFSDWEAKEMYQMNKTPDGNFFWLELNGLTPQQQYVFQYWVDGDIKIADPYAEQVADPWNDQYISSDVFPNLPNYTQTNYGIASVLQTAQTPYAWASSEYYWERPDVEHLVIYELLIRDFLASHAWTDLIDTLDYIKNLGVDAIEIMPFNEFEGNESWGYNTSFYFAPDKYYGHKNDLKRFVEIAHQKGLAVIMDMVMNHAYGQNPMVQLYFNHGANAPASNNPWFNSNYVGQYQWGYDWNHEAQRTKDFLDRLNAYWLKEYHIDGYRFDFTKGFTNHAPGGNIDGFDQSRVNILKRMADIIWVHDPDAYIILEHWGVNSEEELLADYGMKLWRNRSYDYVPAIKGSTGSSNFNAMDAQSHVSYFGSHDEQRLAWYGVHEGLMNGEYNIKSLPVLYERLKMAAAFTFLFPGPKMLWQFDELGYDIDIDFNGRIGNKPLPWGNNGLGYYENPLRQHIYRAYQEILHLRKTISPQALASASTEHKLSGTTRRLSYNTSTTDLVLVGNFGLSEASIDPRFTQTGYWYNYFSGDSLLVSDVNMPIALKVGEWQVFTNQKLSNGVPDVVAVYENPFSVSPYNFTKNDQITLTFDATKAWDAATLGLINANEVYLHAGLVLSAPNSEELDVLIDSANEKTAMTNLGNNIWSITFSPHTYFELSETQEPFKLGVYCHDGNGNLGMGFRNQMVLFTITPSTPFVSIEPPSYTINQEITLTFDAARGNQELVDAEKVYLHSSVDLTNTASPQNSAWQYTVGNWGQDDGIGEMSPVPNTDNKWTITFVPQQYYNLAPGDSIHWLAAVFRSADGNTKGTGTPGPLSNGFIHSNLDFFIQNMPTETITPPILPTQSLLLYPNPTQQLLHFSLNEAINNITVHIYNTVGQKIATLSPTEITTNFYQLNLHFLEEGYYLIDVQGDNFRWCEAFVKW